jgi:hypothetical protein
LPQAITEKQQGKSVEARQTGGGVEEKATDVPDVPGDAGARV